MCRKQYSLSNELPAVYSVLMNLNVVSRFRLFSGGFLLWFRFLPQNKLKLHQHNIKKMLIADSLADETFQNEKSVACHHQKSSLPSNPSMIGEVGKAYLELVADIHRNVASTPQSICIRFR